MESSNVVVECLNSDRCDGELTFQLRWADADVASRSTTGGVRADPIRQTCSCEYSEEQKEELAGRAIAMSQGQTDYPAC